MTKIFAGKIISIIFMPVLIVLWLIGWLLIITNSDKLTQEITPKQTIFFEEVIDESHQYPQEIIIERA
jgi:hypothetical protein